MNFYMTLLDEIIYESYMNEHFNEHSCEYIYYYLLQVELSSAKLSSLCWVEAELGNARGHAVGVDYEVS